MHTPMKREPANVDGTMEERLAKLGAKIDHLIDKASEARDAAKHKTEELKSKGEATYRKGEEALEELKFGLDCAWDELNQAWADIKTGTERAVEKLRSE